MNERDWSLDAEARPRPLILARRLWRALRIVGVPKLEDARPRTLTAQ